MRVASRLAPRLAPRLASVAGLLRTTALVAGTMLIAAPALAQPVGTTFTYQGELSEAGTPANGVYDLRFSLFSSPSGTTQTGTTQCADNVTVTNGQFTVQLDFGSVFTGSQSFVEVQVRNAPTITCSSSGGFVSLAPRQAILPTPYAMNATLLGGNAPSFFTNAANLTGTIADARLSSNVPRLNAPAVFTGAVTALSLSGNASGATNLNATSVATGTLADARLSSNVALRNATNVFTGATNSFGGNVGVGLTTAPQASLHVRGDSTLGTILLTPDVSDSNTQFIFSENTGGTIGMIARYNGAASNTLEILGRSASVDSTPILAIGRDNGIVTVGNATDPGRVNVVGGPVALSISTTGTGDGTVLLPASSVSAAETSNEPGFNSSSATSVVTMDVNASVTLRSVSLNAPSDGFVIVTGSAQINNNNQLSNTTTALAISTSSTANAETSGYRSLVLPGDPLSLTIHETFPVSAGVNTFYLRGWTSGLFVEATRRRITALFVPTQYP